jgi:hypothetical protein
MNWARSISSRSAIGDYFDFLPIIVQCGEPAKLSVNALCACQKETPAGGSLSRGSEVGRRSTILRQAAPLLVARGHKTLTASREIVLWLTL